MRTVGVRFQNPCSRSVKLLAPVSCRSRGVLAEVLLSATALTLFLVECELLEHSILRHQKHVLGG